MFCAALSMCILHILANVVFCAHLHSLNAAYCLTWSIWSLKVWLWWCACVKVCTYVVYKANLSRVPSIQRTSCPSPLMHSSELYKQWKADTLLCKRTMCENMEHTFKEGFKKPSGRVLNMCFGKDCVEGFILERPVVILFFLSSRNL